MKDLILKDWESVQKYPTERRASYSLFAQMEKITRDRGALFHDDRIDAVAGAVRPWVEDLAQDEEQATLAAQRKAFDEMMKNPLGNGRPLPNHTSAASFYGSQRPSAIAALKRRW